MAVSVLIPGMVLNKRTRGRYSSVRARGRMARFKEAITWRKWVKFLQVGLQGHIPTGSLHPNPLDPLDESSGPMTHFPLLRNPTP